MVERAAELMARHKIHALPVVNHDGELIEIVTTTDIIAAFLRSRDSRADMWNQTVGVGISRAHAAERLAALEHVLGEQDAS
jgi:CBS-domain-containing membrane protein